MNSEVIEKVDTRWFQDRLADKRLSQRQLAARMNLDPAAVSLMLRGRRKMSAAEAAEIAKYLNVDVDDVLTHAGAAVRARNAAVHGDYNISDAVEATMHSHDARRLSDDYTKWKTLFTTDKVFQDVLLDTVKLFVSQQVSDDKGKAKGDWGLLKANLGDVTAKAEGVVTEMLDMPVPLSDGTVANLRLPKRLTKADAQRIAALVTAFASPD